MRMERAGPKRADLIARASERELADIIFAYGEERRAARHRPRHRRGAQPSADRDHRRLAEIVRKAVGPRAKDGIDPATRTFQALRIWVNDELGELDRGLAAAERLLAPGGRLAVVSFHSLEDRRVKEFLRGRAGAAPKARATCRARRSSAPPTFRLLSRAAVTPGESEIKANPRARSARLRAAERTHAPAWRRREAMLRLRHPLLDRPRHRGRLRDHPVQIRCPGAGARAGRQLDAKILRHQEAIHVLKAEWAYLKRAGLARTLEPALSRPVALRGSQIGIWPRSRARGTGSRARPAAVERSQRRRPDGLAKKPCKPAHQRTKAVP